MPNFEFSPLIVLLYVYSFFTHCAPSVAYADFFPGEVSPERLEIVIGSSANITCRMNLTMFGGSNSSSLYFVESDTKKRVPQSDIKIINDTTIVYTLQNAMEQDRRYECLSDEKGIAVAHVIVGTPPADVKEFKCRAFNYKYMVCNFTIPHNTLDVKYDLRYYWTSPFRRLKRMPNGKISYKIIYPKQQYIQFCELELITGSNFAICNITKDNGYYHQHYEFYNFTLKGYNSLGSNVQSFGINNFESVIPLRPDVRLEAKTKNSATFQWFMDPLYNEKGLKYEIRLHPEKFNWTDYVYYRVKRNKNNNSYVLDVYNLPYAHYNYTLSMRMRVRSNNKDEDLWSEAAVIDFTTSASIPDAPPQTDVSSFDLIDTTESRVRLYWEQQPFYRENGPNFQYVVKEVLMDDTRVEMSPIHIDRTSAVFLWDRKHKYKFVIASRNDEGYSEESSEISIPALESKRLMEYTPDWIRSIYRESNRTFTLSWNPPPNQNHLVDYTVFWCYSKPALSNECYDTIKFTHLNRHTTQYTTSPQQKEHSVIFAVSANYINFTTGLHWSMCTADISIDLMKMDPELTVISSREINVQWNLVHVCSSILEGYNLTICPVKDVYSEHCTNQSRTIHIEKNEKRHLITDLNPYTAYKIQMYMYSKMKKGKPSDAQILITEEEAPSSPRNLTVYNIKRNSVWLSWSPPLQLNGILRSYVVVYCTEDATLVKICQNSINVLESPYKLENLMNYTNYMVYVLANTTKVSHPSNEVHFKTLVGMPSRPIRLTTTDKNDTILQWIQADMKSERIDFYEISIQFLNHGNVLEERIYGVINSTSCAITVPSCVNEDHKHILRVRAVTAASQSNEINPQMLRENVTKNDVNDTQAKYFTADTTLRCFNAHLSEKDQLKLWKQYHDSNEYVLYKSAWQGGITYNCAEPKVLALIIQYAGLFFVLMGCILICKTTYEKYKKMSNIQARLPPGLDYTTKSNSGTERNAVLQRDDEFYIRSKESATEHKRLLTMDSGYLGESSDVSAIGVSTPPISIGRSSGYNGSVPSIDYYQADDFNARIKPSSSIDDAYTLMQIPKYASEILPANRPVTSSISAKSSKLCDVPEDLVTTSLACDTILSPHSMSTVNSSGYVETRASQKPVIPVPSVSYTTLEAFSRKAPAPPSGYVTPKELLALGQHNFS